MYNGKEMMGLNHISHNGQIEFWCNSDNNKQSKNWPPALSKYTAFFYW